MKTLLGRLTDMTAISLLLVAAQAAGGEGAPRPTIVLKEGTDAIAFVRSVAEALPLIERYNTDKRALRVDAHVNRGPNKLEWGATLLFHSDTDWLYTVSQGGLLTAAAAPEGAIMYDPTQGKYIAVAPAEGKKFCAAFSVDAGLSVRLQETRTDKAVVWINLKQYLSWCSASTKVVSVGTSDRFDLTLQDTKLGKPGASSRSDSMPLRTSIAVDRRYQWPIRRVVMEGMDKGKVWEASLTFAEIDKSLLGSRPTLDTSGLKALKLPVQKPSPDELMALGGIGMILGVEIDTREKLETATKSLTGSSPARQWMALALPQSSTVVRVRAAATQATTNVAKDPRLKKAMALARAGKQDEAEKELRAFLVQHPKHAEALMALGKLLIKKRDFDGAIPVFGKLMAADPKNRDVYHFLVVAYCKKARFREAKEVMSAADDRDLWSAIHPRIRQLIDSKTTTEMKPSGALFDDL